MRGNWHDARHCLQNKSSQSSPSLSVFPVSINAFSAPALIWPGQTWALVFQSSISHFNYFLVTGKRKQHGHKSKVSREAPSRLHEQAEEMYCWRLWNAKEERDVFTWWHCVYPSKADCRERRCHCTILEMEDDWALRRAWEARQSNSQVPAVMEGSACVWCHIFLCFAFCKTQNKKKTNRRHRGLFMFCVMIPRMSRKSQSCIFVLK